MEGEQVVGAPALEEAPVEEGNKEETLENMDDEVVVVSTTPKQASPSTAPPNKASRIAEMQLQLIRLQKALAERKSMGN